MWWWTKIRRAVISPDARRTFEILGPTLVAMRLATIDQAIPDPGQGIMLNMNFMQVPALVHNAVAYNQEDAIHWLAEQHDIAERREDRLETAEWAILIFVGVELVIDAGHLLALWLP